MLTGGRCMKRNTVQISPKIFPKIIHHYWQYWFSLGMDWGLNHCERHLETTRKNMAHKYKRTDGSFVYTQTSLSWLHNSYIHVCSDNTTQWAISIKKVGETNLKWGDQRHLAVGSSQTGLTNCNALSWYIKEANSQSRQSYRWESEWQLDTKVFRLIDHTVGSLEIDLFASRLNHQCDKYISWHPDPWAIAIDFF